jgi:Uncharacterized conserved protein
MEKIKIKTEFIKLDQLLKLAGIVGNGSEGKYLILEGNVKVNGQPETRRGKKIYPKDVVEVGSETISVEL